MLTRGETAALIGMTCAVALFVAALAGVRLPFARYAPDGAESSVKAPRHEQASAVADDLPVGELRVEPFERTAADEGVLDEEAVPRADRTELQRENDILRGRLNDLLQWILTNFRGKYPLPEAFMTRVRVNPLSEDFTLHPDAAELMQVTPEEAAMIDDAFGMGADWLREIEAATIQVRSPYPGKTVLSIPPFEEEGALLRDDLHGALEATLGADRFDRFLAFSGEDLAAGFNYYGEASRTLIFEVLSDGVSDPQLVIRDAMVVPEGENTHRIEATEATVTNLPSRYFHYLSWLPDYVAAYATP